MRLSAFAGSIRRALVALVLVAVLPALAIILYTGLEARKHALVEARANAMLLAQNFGEIQKRSTQGVRQMLAVLSRTPLVRDARSPATSALLREVTAADPLLANLSVAGSDGTVLASSRPFANVSIADREYFQQTLRDKSFHAGKFQVGKLTGLPVFAYCLPVLDTRDNILGVILASIRLDSYSVLFENAAFPPGSVLTLADREGNRILRHPRVPEIQIGEPLPNDIWKAVNGPADMGTSVRTGADGQLRIYGFVRLRLDSEITPYMYIIVGIPEEHGRAVANALLYRNLELLAVATLLALVTSWFLGKLMIGRRLERLAEVTEKVGSGDLSQHIHIVSSSGELGRLERSVNAMIDALIRDAKARAIYEDALQNSYEELEQRVEDRTQDLREANARLVAEAEERAQVEEALRQSEEKHRALYEQSSVGIFVMSTDGLIFDANPAALDLLGYSSEELIGMRYRDLIHPDSLAAHPVDAEGLRAGKTLRAERIFVTRDGRSVPVDVSGRLVSQTMFQAVFKDATERKKLEQLRDDVERITRHDLKTPLMGMVHVPAMLLKNDNLTDKQRELLLVIQDSAYRMLRTINMSLALYRMEARTYECERKPFDMLRTVRKVAEETTPYAQSRRIELEVLLDGAPAGEDAEFLVEGEEYLCMTMLENLVKNAIEASPEERRVTLGFDGPGRALAISNMGEVPPAIRENFFEKYTTSGKKWGTGLGTYSARLIAVTHGWDISLDADTPGETTIVIRFPEPGGESS